MAGGRKYTVLGSTGFIGNHLSAALRARGDFFDTPARGDDGIFTRDLGHVFYCIGYTADFAKDPAATVEAHAAQLGRILEKASFDKLVYLSSVRLYDGLLGAVNAEDRDLVLNPAKPRHLYDLSKALGENLCLNASNSRACVARLAAVYDAAPDATGFLPEMLHRLRRERRFTMNSDSGTVRDYVTLSDTIAALLVMMDRAGCEIVNVASGQNVSNREIADALNESGCDITIKRETPRQDLPVNDITKIRQWGINPVSVPDYLRAYMKDGV
jgi:nucleoside-diphosphate-sugar epimerase